MTRVGIFGIGLAAYWPQFEGLRERLERYQHGIEDRLRSMGVEIASAGLVPLEALTQAVELRPVRSEADAEQPDARHPASVAVAA